MPVVASALFVALISIAAYGIGEHGRWSNVPRSQYALSTVPTSPISCTESVQQKALDQMSDADANKMCDPPSATQKYVPTSKQALWYPATVTLDGTKVQNLYGKPCKGKAIDAKCSGPNVCDAKTFSATSQCYFNCSWQSCKTPEAAKPGTGKLTTPDGTPVQLASNKTPGTTSDAPPPEAAAFKEVESQPDPIINPQAQAEVQEVKEAYENSAQPETTGGPVTRPTEIASLDQLDSSPDPVSTPQPGSGIALERPIEGYLPVASPDNVGGLMSDTSPFANAVGRIGPTLPGGNNFAAITPAPAHDTFGWNNPYGSAERPRVGGFFNTEPQYPFNFGSGDEQPYFGNVLSGGLSMENTLRNFTDFVVNSFTSGARQPQTVQVQIVQPTVITRAPVLPRVAQQQLIVPSNREVFFSTSSSWVVYSATDIGKAASDTEQQNAALRKILFEADRYAGLPIPDAFEGVDLSEPFVLTQATGTSAQLVRTLSEGPRSVQTRPSSASPNPLERSSGIVDTTHSISIPELLSVISSGSLDLIREFAGRGSPEAPVVVTRLEGENAAPIILGGSPTLPRGELSGIQQQRAPSLVPGVSDTSRPSSERKKWSREDFEARIRADATAIFQDSLPVLRQNNYVPLAQPTAIYPDVVPVPIAREETSDTPSLAELIVVNGVKELTNLARTVWSFILPPRE